MRLERSGRLLLLTALLMPLPVAAELWAGFYLGQGVTRDTDVHLEQGATELTFEDVSWEDESFDSPLYYGLRLSYWREYEPTWGFLLDFTHAKMYAETEETVDILGTRDGVAAQGEERLGDTFGELNFSHGHNLLTVNGVYRWRPRESLQPYLGAGAGVAFPHVEVRLGTATTQEYQVAGRAFQLLAGVGYRLGERFGLFGEYKLSYARMEVDLDGGGKLKLEPWTDHFLLGVAYRFQ